MVLLWGLLDLGASLAWAPYITIAFVGPMVILAERALPYRPEWQASWPDLAEDGLYLTFVQIALPLVLAWRRPAPNRQRWIGAVLVLLGGLLFRVVIVFSSDRL